MVSMPFSHRQMAEEVLAFAASIDTAKARWLYCLSRVKYVEFYKGTPYTAYASRTMPVCERILGGGVYVSPAKFRRLDEEGFEAANVRRHPLSDFPPPYSVGPFEPWHVGHLYFARVTSHPHVLKIGFSRRVRDRLEDIETQNRTKLEIRPGHLKVGTMADEHWWHRDWNKFRISGEWFFEPRSADRSLPDFLATKAEAA